MKKTILFLTAFLLLNSAAALARPVETNVSYVYSSRFDQVRVGAIAPLGTNFQIGLESKYVNDKIGTDEGGFKNPVQSVYLPLKLDISFMQFALTPFYYFKNDSTQGLLQSYAAYGLQGQILFDLVADEINETQTQAFLGAGYVRQKGNVLSNDIWKNEHFNQTAFSLGIRQNFYNTFLFQVAGEVYTYPDGISRVQAFQGMVDQKDLGFTQAYDVNRNLGKYTLSTRISRLWAEKHASLYAAYHYAELYTQRPEHSIIVGNSFALLANIQMDVAYNHLRNSSNRDKRDVFFVNLSISF